MRECAEHVPLSSHVVLIPHERAGDQDVFCVDQPLPCGNVCFEEWPSVYGVEACAELLPRGVLFVQELVAEGTPVVMVRGLSGQCVRP